MSLYRTLKSCQKVADIGLGSFKRMRGYVYKFSKLTGTHYVCNQCLYPYPALAGFPYSP